MSSSSSNDDRGAADDSAIYLSWESSPLLQFSPKKEDKGVRGDASSPLQYSMVDMEVGASQGSQSPREDIASVEAR